MSVKTLSSVLPDRRCCLRADLCTMKHTVCQPFALMEACRSPRRSKSKTSPSAARTFSDIEPWPALLADALVLEESLDDTKRQYRETTLTIAGDNKSVRRQTKVR